MKKSTQEKRSYSSPARAEGAEDTRRRILRAARSLFGRKGVDAVTIADIGDKAGVAGSTIYAIYRSKDGVLRAIMEETLFGGGFREALRMLEGVADPVDAIAMTANVAGAIYESESSDLGLLRHASGFSPALRKMEQEFEGRRYAMQEARLRALFDSGRARKELAFEEARRILWMYTSRDIYRMLVHESGWTPVRYRDWLSRTLLEALVARDA